MTISAFGSWQATIDGRPIGPLPSRPARELIVRMSLQKGSVARDRLASDLWPAESDISVARKRLSQELSRAQSAAGSQIWETTRDWLQVREGVALESDVARLLDAARPERIRADAESERARIADVLDPIDNGAELLPGHESEWVQSLRREAERSEIILLQHLVSLDRGAPSEVSLQAATRWAELEPYSDAANAAVAANLAALRGGGSVAGHARDVGRRYADELGLAPPAELEEAAQQLGSGSTHPVWSRIEALEAARVEQRGRADDDRVRDLLELDGLLRRCGQQLRREPVLAALVDAGAPPDEVTWRRAEVAFFAVDDPLAHELLDDHRDRWGDSDRLILVETHLGEPDDDVVEQLAQLVSSSEDLELRMDAALRLVRVCDLQMDYGRAETVLLELAAMADGAGSVYHRAAAAFELGWNRVRMSDNANGETYLREALALAEQIDAASILASVNGGLGFLYYEHQRPASSARHIAVSAELSQRIGDVRAEFRWRYNLSVASQSLGDRSTIVAQADRLQALLEQRPHLGAEWTLPAGLAMVNAYEARGDREGALALSRKLADDAAAAGVESFVRSGKAQVAIHLLFLGRADEALAVCSALLLELSDRSDGYLRVIKGLQGCCLVASGQPEAGYRILSDLVESNTASLNNLEWVLRWLIRAATMLGDAERERAAAVRGRRYLQTIRADLSDEQWSVMLAGNETIGPLHAEVGRILGEF